MSKAYLVAILVALLRSDSIASSPVQGAYSTLRAVVVARSITECRFDGGPGKCSEYYLAVQVFPDAGTSEPTKFVVAARDFEDREPHPSDKFLVGRELTLTAVRDLACDRVVTYEPRGWSCGPEGGSRIYDWRKLVSKHGHPAEGAHVPCFRLVAPIPELGLQ